MFEPNAHSSTIEMPGLELHKSLSSSRVSGRCAFEVTERRGCAVRSADDERILFVNEDSAVKIGSYEGLDSF